MQTASNCDELFALKLSLLMISHLPDVLQRFSVHHTVEFRG